MPPREVPVVRRELSDDLYGVFRGVAFPYLSLIFEALNEAELVDIVSNIDLFLVFFSLRWVHPCILQHSVFTSLSQ